MWEEDGRKGQKVKALLPLSSTGAFMKVHFILKIPFESARSLDVLVVTLL